MALTSPVWTGLLERRPDIALPGEIVDLVDPRALDHAQDIAEFPELEIDQFDIAGNAELVQPGEIGGRHVAHRADDGMALLQQQPGEIGAVLPVNACDERPLGHVEYNSTTRFIVALCGKGEQGRHDADRPYDETRPRFDARLVDGIAAGVAVPRRANTSNWWRSSVLFVQFLSGAALAMKARIEDMGVPADCILVDSSSRTTGDHPDAIAALPNVDRTAQRFLVVTDREHSRRAAGCFRRGGYRHFTVSAGRRTANMRGPAAAELARTVQ